VPDDTKTADHETTEPKAAAAPKRLTKYTHVVCGTDGEMDEAMEDRYYSQEHPVNSLFCTTCGAGIRIGDDGEMVWAGTKNKVPEHE
jgi:hypothetical protein